MKTLNPRQKSAIGLALLSIGMFCMSASLSLPHLGINPSWTLAIGSIHLPLDFFRGFLIGLQIILQISAIVLLADVIRQQRSSLSTTS